MRHVLGWLLVAGMFGALAYAAWCELLIGAQDRRARADRDFARRNPARPELDRDGPHWTRDPSPTPRPKQRAS